MIGEIVARQKEIAEEKERYIEALKRRIKGEVKQNEKQRTAIKKAISILTEALEECYEQGESTRHGKPENWKR